MHHASCMRIPPDCWNACPVPSTRVRLLNMARPAYLSTAHDGHASCMYPPLGQAAGPPPAEGHTLCMCTRLGQAAGLQPAKGTPPACTRHGPAAGPLPAKGMPPVCVVGSARLLANGPAAREGHDSRMCSRLGQTAGYGPVAEATPVLMLTGRALGLATEPLGPRGSRLTHACPASLPIQKCIDLPGAVAVTEVEALERRAGFSQRTSTRNSLRMALRSAAPGATAAMWRAETSVVPSDDMSKRRFGRRRQRNTDCDRDQRKCEDTRSHVVTYAHAHKPAYPPI